MSKSKPKKLCVVSDCERPSVCKGLCHYHYARHRRGVLDERRRDPDEPLPPREKWEFLGDEAALIAAQER